MKKLLFFAIVFFSAIFCVSKTHAAITVRPTLNLGLMAYWNMDDGSGSTVVDRSGNGNTGTLTNMDPATDWVAAKFGKGLDFDGINDRVSVPTLTNYGAAGAISVWMMPAVTMGASAKVKHLYMTDSNAGNDAGETDLTVGLSGAIRFAYWSGSSWTTEYVDSTATSWQAGQWYHIVATFGPEMRLYVDGVLQGSYPSTRVPNAGNGSYIASYAAQPDSWYGQLDDVRVYNYALSAGEVRRLYQLTGTKVLPPSRQGLVGYWSMNEGTGTKAEDMSGNGRNGNFAGSPSWATGKKGNAVNFTGANDYVESTNFADNLPNFSAAAWFKSTDINAAGFPAIIAKMTAGSLPSGTGWGIYFHAWNFNVGTIHALIQTNSGAAWVSKYISVQYNDDKWHHVAMTVSGGNTVTLYIDGHAGGTTHNGGTIGSYANSSNVRIGRDDSTRSFNGAIDEVRLYDRTLSAAEIAKLYATSQAKVNTSQNSKLTSGLVGEWSFNGPDISGTTAYDRSGQGNNGTISGATVARGKVGQALSFDPSVNQHVDLGSAIILPPTGFSFSAWFNAASDDGGICGGRRIIDYNPTNNSSLSKYTGVIVNNGYIHAMGFTGLWDADFYTTYNLHQWNHVVVTWNGTTFSSYLNGVNFGSAVKSLAAYTSTFNTYLGDNANNPGLSCQFDGKIDEVRTYNRALSQSEINQLYNMGK